MLYVCVVAMKKLKSRTEKGIPPRKKVLGKTIER